MQTYKETIRALAREALGTYMGGGHPYFDTHSRIVAFIYDIEPDRVTDDVSEAYRSLQWIDSK